MRLVEQETYVMSGVRRYAGVWVQNVESLGWASWRGLTGAEFSQRFNEQRDAGRMPIDIDMYDTSQGMRYAVIWVQNPESLAWQLWRDMTSAAFTAKFNELAATHRMLAVESVQASAGQRYAGIWVQNRNGRAWAERRDMTAQSFANHWNRYRDQGFRLVGFNRYQTSSGTRYAGIWRQNNDRPNWTLKAKVDTKIQSELDSSDVPGISVAVFHKGQSKYQRGFGFADINDSVWMDSEHVGSLASVSKAVAGVLTMRMVEQDLVDLDDRTRDLVPTMPARHTHTVGDLLANRGCVGHYDDIKLSAGQILTEASLDTMWTKPDSDNNYAYGWNTGTEKGHKVVAKDGSQTGSLTYLRIFPDDDIVVAVMMNDRSGSQNVIQLGMDIGTIVLDSLP